MARRWLIVMAFAALLGSCVYRHQARPFSVPEWIHEWEGHGPDPGTSEFRAAQASAEHRARGRQRAAPYQAAATFLLVLGMAMLWRAGKAWRHARRGRRTSTSTSLPY
jgi:hypothetical protein